MTRRERMQRRVENLELWAESASQKAAGRFSAADRAVDGIPFGQPILVGHHSEKRHRRALEKCQNAMRKGIELEDKARHHASVADTLTARLETNIFSDDSDAIAQLEARIAEREAACDRITTINKALRREIKAGATAANLADAEWCARLGLTAVEIAGLLRELRYGMRTGSTQLPTFPAYTTSNMRNLIRADRKRIEAIRQQTKRQADADAAGGMLITRHVDVNWCSVTFAEKPEREILNALKAAGYCWGGGRWSGYLDKLPAAVSDLETEQSAC